ncbi:glycosyltransferase family 4 protein [Spongiactinospora sp. TRM90649]|uniref:glycosyltransferase family 4 protein n=1 Tax=Spongiactinospora sp. TRM90649 TaxID=3031114 RepID=UPI0023F7F21C|nr:glycosyltransferase family 4 protein [Spongiactinospora sp. TRM90649]MDF5751060.1 glycosyltransferase family 4 protein [Spongiactinospora sp. TRM90649]
MSVDPAATGGPRLGARVAGGEEAARPPGRLSGVRVAILNFREPAQRAAGGAEEYAWQVGRHLTGEGASVSFATAREPGQTRAERRDGIELWRMGGRFTVYLLLPIWLLVNRRRFDVVVDCMNGVPFFAPLVVAEGTPVISLVHHVHARQFYAFFPRWLARIGCFIEGPVARLVYRRCATVTVSESSRRELITRLRRPAPIKIVPNGSPAVRPVARDVAVPGDPAVVYLGRLVGHKRIERVVSLAARLRHDRPGLRVHVIGRGPERDGLAALAGELGVADRVHLHGYLAEPDKNAVLGAAVLNVTASEFEGWGLTVIEAAGLGVPTVAYDVPGLRDSVRHGETGWLVREGEYLADVVDRALTELADPRRRAEIRTACLRWAAEFTWDRTGAAMTDLIAARLRPGGAAVPAAALALAPGETDPT